MTRKRSKLPVVVAKIDAGADNSIEVMRDNNIYKAQIYFQGETIMFSENHHNAADATAQGFLYLLKRGGNAN